MQVIMNQAFFKTLFYHIPPPLLLKIFTTHKQDFPSLLTELSGLVLLAPRLKIQLRWEGYR